MISFPCTHKLFACRVACGKRVSPACLAPLHARCLNIVVLGFWDRVFWAVVEQNLTFFWIPEPNINFAKGKRSCLMVFQQEPSFRVQVLGFDFSTQLRPRGEVGNWDVGIRQNVFFGYCPDSVTVG